MAQLQFQQQIAFECYGVATLTTVVFSEFCHVGWCDCTSHPIIKNPPLRLAWLKATALADRGANAGSWGAQSQGLLWP